MEDSGYLQTDFVQKDFTGSEMAADEEKETALNDLQDDSVKLVAYTIVSLKRGRERILDGGQDSVIVTDSMTGKAFMSWILAKYMQQKVDDPAQPGRKIRRGDLLPRVELKYLRVYYVVSTRWPREPLEFEQKQVEVLQEIRDEIPRT
jgi:hypothetical protein